MPNVVSVLCVFRTRADLGVGIDSGGIFGFIDGVSWMDGARYVACFKSCAFRALMALCVMSSSHMSSSMVVVVVVSCGGGVSGGRAFLQISGISATRFPTCRSQLLTSVFVELSSSDSLSIACAREIMGLICSAGTPSSSILLITRLMPSERFVSLALSLSF